MTEPSPSAPESLPGAAPAPLMGASDIRRLAEEIGVRPTKTLGQNFVIDGNTIRRIVNAADIRADETVLEVGPGLGSLTLGLLDAARTVVAVEIDPGPRRAPAGHGRCSGGRTPSGISTSSWPTP